MMRLEHEDLTDRIIRCAIRVHRALGPGLLESVYENCLAHELVKEGLQVRRQVDVPIVYDGVKLESGFRIDLLVEETVVIELKAVESLSKIHEAQLMTYLRLSKKPVGLLLNFNELRLKDGLIRRAMTRSR